MSRLNTTREINTETKEGQCLIAAIAMIGAKTLDKTADEIYMEVMQLANDIYSNEETK
jgi:hypothetical protein